jgi:hypothetical protein
MMIDFHEKAGTLNFLTEFNPLCRENDWRKAFEILEKMVLVHR